MKTLITVLILLAVCSSCQHTKPKTFRNDSFIDGEWSLCGIIYLKNGRQFSEIMFNVCPTITFIKNHTGFIKRSDPKLLYFNWQFDDNKLVIRHTINEDKDNIIGDGTYKLIYINKKVIDEMALLDTVKNIKYRIGRKTNL
jgi:hypothetical protein